MSLVIAPMLVSQILRMYLDLQSMERTHPRWITVELKHIRNFKTAAKGSRIVNHAWPYDHVGNLTNASIFYMGNYRLKSVWNLGTPQVFL